MKYWGDYKRVIDLSCARPPSNLLEPVGTRSNPLCCNPLGPVVTRLEVPLVGVDYTERRKTEREKRYPRPTTERREVLCVRKLDFYCATMNE